MARIYAVGDIFGCANELDAVLGSMDLSGSNMVVFLGNYIDKGPDSRSVVDLVSDLQHNYGQEHVVALCGKHEESFLNWLDDPESAQWFMEDEDLATCSTFMKHKTWESFEQVLFEKEMSELSTSAKIAIDEDYGYLVDWMRGLPSRYEIEDLDLVFTRRTVLHGGQMHDLTGHPHKDGEIPILIYDTDINGFIE
ncbi:MAG: metallophosphoesterase [Lachnospiraceae bacterium]|nr:metallophosphoesterase [Lachnospiraceae bacterium]